MDGKDVATNALRTLALGLFTPGSDGKQTAVVTRTLVRYGEAVLRFLLQSDVHIHVLREGQRYDSASPALKRLGVDVDAWPSPPAGLFVVEERTVYLRSTCTMTVAHETAHAIDCALGDGVYYSSMSPVIRKMFAAASNFITDYSSTGMDEYLAEAMRGFIEANTAASFWPRVTRARLRRVDPDLFSHVEHLLTVEIPSRVYGAAARKTA